MALTDQEFLSQINALTLDDHYFDHQGHLRFAWLVLSDNELEDGIHIVCSSIKNYAESLGASTKFNLTLTDAICRIIASRLTKSKAKDWKGFLLENADLETDLLGVLTNFYQKKTLFSEKARVSLVAPDIKPIE